MRWDEYDLVVVRSTWDYPRRREEFLDGPDRCPTCSNPSEVVEYSSDKHYLADLESRGLRIIPSHFTAVGEAPQFFDVDFVVKPCVGAGSLHVERYRPEEVARAARARRHAPS